MYIWFSYNTKPYIWLILIHRNICRYEFETLYGVMALFVVFIQYPTLKSLVFFSVISFQVLPKKAALFPAQSFLLKLKEIVSSFSPCKSVSASLIIFTTILWTCFSLVESLLNCGVWSWIHYSRYSPMEKGKVSDLPLHFVSSTNQISIPSALSHLNHYWKWWVQIQDQSLPHPIWISV